MDGGEDRKILYLDDVMPPTIDTDTVEVWLVGQVHSVHNLGPAQLLEVTKAKSDEVIELAKNKGKTIN